MSTYRIISLIIAIFVLYIRVDSQIVYEPINKDIYSLLESLSIKGIIEYDGTIKPLPRIKVAEFLLSLRDKSQKLTGLERELREYYCKDYYYEIKLLEKNDSFNKLSILNFNDIEKRLRLFSYKDSVFIFNLDPILGYKIGSYYKSKITHRWNGLSFYGYIGSNIGFQLDFRDNRIENKFIKELEKDIFQKKFISTRSGKEYVEYDDVQAALSYNWKWGNITFAKTDLNVGNGRSGQIIISDNAPSFPFIRLDINPVSWMSFTYLHGFLHSSIIDSNTFRWSSLKRDSYNDISKYLALHFFVFKPYQNLNLTLGESIVYSEKIEPIYLIPVMFFRLADHYMMDLKNESNSGDNAQLFAEITYTNYDLCTKLYSTIFIDELNVDDIFKKGGLSAVALMAGLQSEDLFFKNSSR
jgi:hypothetical protein